jgi:hypothetical protein
MLCITHLMTLGDCPESRQYTWPTMHLQNHEAIVLQIGGSETLNSEAIQTLR